MSSMCEAIHVVGLLHLKSFALWAKELRCLLESIQTNGQDESHPGGACRLSIISAWDQHVKGMGQEVLKEDANMFKLS